MAVQHQNGGTLLLKNRNTDYRKEKIIYHTIKILLPLRKGPASESKSDINKSDDKFSAINLISTIMMERYESQ